MKQKLTNNFLLKILSVVTAIILWLIVVNIDDAVESGYIRNVKVNLINTDIITSQDQTFRIEEGTDVVDLKVYARRSVLSKLKSSDFVATADMQKDLRYNSMVKIEVAYVGNQSISSVEANRSNVLVSIEQEVTEQFKVIVDTNGQPANGLVIGSKVPEQTLIEITGPISVVERINRVVAAVDTTGITGTTVRTCRLQLLNGDGDPIDGTYLEYIGKDKEFEVTITTLNKKLVGISFDISKAAPEGYGLAAITYKPETVTIAGMKSQIAPIYNLNIPPEALNPEGQTGSIEQIVDISQYLDEGLIIPDEDEREIVVTMDIIPYETSSYFFTPDQINYDGIPEGYELDVSESGTLEIPISGLASDLAQLSTDIVELHADLSGVRARTGNYTVPVTVTLPKEYTCPEGYELTIRLKKAQAEE